MAAVLDAFLLYRLAIRQAQNLMLKVTPESFVDEYSYPTGQTQSCLAYGLGSGQQTKERQQKMYWL